jgi:hypothetical protein
MKTIPAEAQANPSLVVIEIWIDRSIPDWHGWMSQTYNDPETTEVFGDVELPLPWMDDVEESLVVATLQMLHPDALIKVRQ